MTTTKEKTDASKDIIAATKQFVTNTRTWATTMRDASWAPWLSMVEHNETLAQTMRPWVDMSRTAHDRWLEMYETQSHDMIDRSYDLMNRLRP